MCVFKINYDMGKFLETVLGIIVGLYILVSQFMTVIFFIEYCKSGDSLLKNIFIDPFLSEIKGLLWVFFI